MVLQRPACGRRCRGKVAFTFRQLWCTRWETGDALISADMRDSIEEWIAGGPAITAAAMLAEAAQQGQGTDTDWCWCWQQIDCITIMTIKFSIHSTDLCGWQRLLGCTLKITDHPSLTSPFSAYVGLLCPVISIIDLDLDHYRHLLEVTAIFAKSHSEGQKQVVSTFLGSDILGCMYRSTTSQKLPVVSSVFPTTDCSIVVRGLRHRPVRWPLGVLIFHAALIVFALNIHCRLIAFRVNIFAPSICQIVVVLAVYLRCGCSYL